LLFTVPVSAGLFLPELCSDRLFLSRRIGPARDAQPDFLEPVAHGIQVVARPRAE
jgi:hypothetical protein